MLAAIKQFKEVTTRLYGKKASALYYNGVLKVASLDGISLNDFSRLLQHLAQIACKNRLDLQDWRLIAELSPGCSNMIANLANNYYAAVRNSPGRNDFKLPAYPICNTFIVRARRVIDGEAEAVKRLQKAIDLCNWHYLYESKELEAERYGFIGLIAGGAVLAITWHTEWLDWLWLPILTTLGIL